MLQDRCRTSSLWLRAPAEMRKMCAQPAVPGTRRISGSFRLSSLHLWASRLLQRSLEEDSHAREGDG
jgi:hypothetical protein